MSLRVRLWLMLAMTVGVASVSGCLAFQRDNIRFYRLPAHQINAPSEKVIEATRRVIAAKKFGVISAKATELDAEFYVRSALGTRLIIHVVAKGQSQTKVQFLIGGRRDTTIAALLLEEIKASATVAPSP